MVCGFHAPVAAEILNHRDAKRKTASPPFLLKEERSVRTREDDDDDEPAATIFGYTTQKCRRRYWVVWKQSEIITAAKKSARNKLDPHTKDRSEK
jgi:hypothetical protein